MTALSAARRLDSGQALVIDARTAEEYARGHVRGSVFLYPDDFPRQAGFLRRDRAIIAVCEAGWRSSLLVSWMDRLGFKRAFNLIGGMRAWRSAALPIETGDEQEAFR
jgi:rhodanese-related sulfurtransferase